MRLTKKKAIEISIELWEWLAETGAEEKADWDGWEKYGRMVCDCVLCEFSAESGDGDRCDSCPYFQSFGFCETFYKEYTIYKKWHYAKTKPTRKKYAKLFLEQLRSLK